MASTRQQIGLISLIVFMIMGTGLVSASSTYKEKWYAIGFREAYFDVQLNGTYTTPPVCQGPSLWYVEGYRDGQPDSGQRYYEVWKAPDVDGWTNTRPLIQNHFVEQAWYQNKNFNNGNITQILAIAPATIRTVADQGQFDALCSNINGYLSAEPGGPNLHQVVARPVGEYAVWVNSHKDRGESDTERYKWAMGARSFPIKWEITGVYYAD